MAIDDLPVSLHVREASRSLAWFNTYLTSAAQHYDRALVHLSNVSESDKVDEAFVKELYREMDDVALSVGYFEGVLRQWQPEDEPETSTEQSPPLLTESDSTPSSKPAATGSFEPDCLPGPSET